MDTLTSSQIFLQILDYTDEQKGCRLVLARCRILGHDRSVLREHIISITKVQHYELRFRENFHDLRYLVIKKIYLVKKIFRDLRYLAK